MGNFSVIYKISVDLKKRLLDMPYLRHLALGPLVLSLILGAVGAVTLEVARPVAVWAQSESSIEADRLFIEGFERYQVSQWQQALDRWQRALELYRQDDNRTGEANTLINIGIIYRLLGDYPQALTYYDQGLTLIRELGDRAGEASTLGNISVIYQSLKFSTVGAKTVLTLTGWV